MICFRCQVFISLNVDHFSKYDTVMKFLSFDLSKSVSSGLTAADIICYKDILICHNCCSKQANRQEGNVPHSDSRQTQVCENAEVSEKERPVCERSKDFPTQRREADVENITDLKNVSYDFNLKQFLEERGYAVGKNGFDKNLMICQGKFQLNFIPTVRTTRPEKCDIFAQRYQSQPITKNSRNTANIFLTFRNNVKMFHSQHIMHNF